MGWVLVCVCDLEVQKKIKESTNNETKEKESRILPELTKGSLETENLQLLLRKLFFTL